MTSLQTIQFLPYPELVEPEADARPYTIMDSLAVEGLPSTGMVSKEQRLMFVPLSASGSSIVRHEMAHVRWSPSRLPKVGFDPCVLLAVEDARINLAMQRRRLDVHILPDLMQRVTAMAANDLDRGDIAAFALRAIAALGTNAVADILAAPGPISVIAAEFTRMVLAGVQARLERSRALAADKSIATFNGAIATARYVAKELESRGFALRPDGSLRVTLLEGGCSLSCSSRGRFVMARTFRLAARDGESNSGAQDINAAEMLISKPALPIACAPSAPSTVRRSRREGSLVSRPNRWFSDRAIFRSSGRGYGGTVLIDTSASMKLDAAGIDRILRSAPSATLIAIYSGENREGELRIVARDGRRVADDGLTPFGKGNLIDLPALKWLAKQAGPRVWLSDGRVTGVHDWASSLLVRQCQGVCLRFGIRRVETAEEAAQVLGRRPLRARRVLP